MFAAMTTLIEVIGGPKSIQRTNSTLTVLEEEEHHNNNILDKNEADWKKDLLAQSDLDETKARMIAQAEEQWRADALNKLNKDHFWKMTYILTKCINHKHANAMVEAEASDKRKIEALANVTKNTFWKISYLSRTDIDAEDVEFYDMCFDEDVAEIFSNCTKQWKKDMMMKHIDLPIWKAQCLMSSHFQWQGKALMQSKYEAQAKAIVECQQPWLAQALLKIPINQTWKLKLLKKSNDDWQMEMLIKVDNEEKGKYISETDMESIGALIMESDQIWKCKAIAETDSLWVAQILSKVKHQWQAKVVTFGVKSDMEKWRIEHVPDIQDETIATQYLFSSKRSDDLPVWLFKLGMKIANNDDKLAAHQKMEKIFSAYQWCQWKVELIANLDQEDMWKMEFIQDIICKEVAEQAEKCTSQDHWLLTIKCPLVWQAKMVAETPEEWKQALLCKHGLERWKAEMYLSETEERKCQLISKCTQKWQGEMVQNEKEEWKCKILANTEEQWRAEFIQKAQEEWRANLMSKGADKVRTNNIDDQWRYQLMLEAEHEWKAIAISEVPEMWRAEMIANEPLEWKVNLITEGHPTDRRDERWRLKLIEPLTKEWQVKMVLASNAVWKAKLIAGLGEHEERRGSELIQCTTERFAAIIMDGYLDSLYN